MAAIVLFSSDAQKDGHHPSMQGAMVVEHLFNPTMTRLILRGELANGRDPLTSLA